MPARLVAKKNKVGIRLMPTLSYPTAFQQSALIFQPFYTVVYGLPLQMLHAPHHTGFKKT
ncbi:hypothetical protein [Pontibacter russatus]|uniref:hypothetical protein n=1 Tax=Pontibacter russatus TaxID=2694929 RepID=UPI00137B7101|nr:hypothetical protein [Pontibacter russatus]